MNPPVALSERIKQYLDAEASWYRRRVEYLGKFRMMKAIKEETQKQDKTEGKAENKKKEDELMKDDKYVSLRMKRKRIQRASKEEPKAKRAKVSKPEEEEEVSEEQWGRFTDELETRYKMNPVLIDEMGERIDKFLLPKVTWSLKRTHTNTYEEQIKAETTKKIQEWKTQEKDEKKLEAMLTELKQKKKNLREVVVMQAKVMATLTEEVVKWLSKQEERVRVRRRQVVLGQRTTSSQAYETDDQTSHHR
jgi:hypothetical protein